MNEHSSFGASCRWVKLGSVLERWLLEISRRHKETHVPKPAISQWETLAWSFLKEERSLRENIDTLVRKACSRSKLPGNLSKTGAFYFSARIFSAMDFFGQVFPLKSEASPFGDVPAHWTDQQALEWLLIDLWQCRADQWLKLHALKLTNPFAFF